MYIFFVFNINFRSEEILTGTLAGAHVRRYTRTLLRVKYPHGGTIIKQTDKQETHLFHNGERIPSYSLQSICITRLYVREPCVFVESHFKICVDLLLFKEAARNSPHCKHVAVPIVSINISSLVDVCYRMNDFFPLILTRRRC